MTRVKGGPVTHLRHKKTLKYNKGNFGTRSRLFRRANETMLKSMWYATRDRKNRKRDLRRLWITRINAGARANGLSYSKFIYAMKNSGHTAQPENLSRSGNQKSGSFQQCG